MLTLTLALALFAAPAPEETKVVKPTDDEIKKAQDQIVDALKAINGNYGRIQAITDEAVLKAFPKHLCFSVMFPQYPVARVSPPGHSSSNIYVVPREQGGKPLLFPEAGKLEGFFKGNLPPANDEARAKDAVRAWLALASVYSNDGFYKFQLMDEATQVGTEDKGKKATGKVVAMEGGNGDITGTVVFDAAGKLTGATVAAKLRPGPRPICQATKLLDADPIVRRMAEQDLLIMGKAAKSYLDEQRTKAHPELQKAIDRLWQRILDEDR